MTDYSPLIDEVMRETRASMSAKVAIFVAETKRFKAELDAPSKFGSLEEAVEAMVEHRRRFPNIAEQLKKVNNAK